MAIQAAWRDARETTEKAGVAKVSYDNMLFWQRAGQRCLNILFSPAEDLQPRSSSRYGVGNQTIDPMEEAARAALRKKLGTPAPMEKGLKGQWQNQRISDHRRKLLEIMDSVEYWLRAGRFRSVQMSPPNTQIVQKEASRRKELAKEALALKKAIEEGIEASVQEMLENGDAQDEAQARAAARMIHDIVGGMGTSDEQQARQEQEQRLGKIERELLESQMEEGDREWCEEVNMHAVGDAKSLVTAAFLNGPSVTHQLAMCSFLSFEKAENVCADCDAKVHVLDAMFLTTQFGICLKCYRHRCGPCQKKAAAWAIQNPKDTKNGCLRCRESPKKKSKS